MREELNKELRELTRRMVRLNGSEGSGDIQLGALWNEAGEILGTHGKSGDKDWQSSAKSPRCREYGPED